MGKKSLLQLSLCLFGSIVMTSAAIASTSSQDLPLPFAEAPPPSANGHPNPPMSWDNGLLFSNADGSKTLRISGQIALSHSRFNGAYNQDIQGRGRAGQDSSIQTARLNIGGNITKNWQYAFQIANLGDQDDTLYFRQAKMTFTGWHFANIIIGKDSMNYGLDNMHDVYNTYGTSFTMLSGAFTPSSSLGIGFKNYYPSNKITWNAGIYSFGNVIRPASSELKGEPGFQQDTAAYIARIGKTLFHDADLGKTLFVQVSGFYLEGSGEQALPIAVDGNVLGTIGADKIPPLSSGPIAAGAIQKESNGIDVGVATEYGPLSIESEYTHVRTMIGGTVNDHPRYEDAYIQGGLVLTGEHRQFDETNGYLMGVEPNSKWGAVELIARYEGIRLRSNIGDNNNATGSNGRTVTAGFDWYVNKHVRIAFDGTHLWRWGPGVSPREGNGMVVQANIFT